MGETSLRYLFALSDGGGTLPPEPGVVQRLVQRGHRVTVLVEASGADAAARTGARVLSLQDSATRAAPRHAAYRDWEMKNPLRLARGMAEHMLIGPAADDARAVTRAIAEFKPSLVVSSLTNLGAVLVA